MSRLFPRLSAALLIATAVFSLALAQDEKDEAKKAAPAPDNPPTESDYRQFFKKPQTVPEFWNAVQFEIDVGRLDLAGSHLRGLMAMKPSQEDLFKLGDRVGMAAILRLRNIRPWVQVPTFNEKRLRDEVDRLEKAREDAEKIGKLRTEIATRKKAYENAVAFNEQAYKDVEELIGQVSTAIRKTLKDPERIKKFVKNLAGDPEEKEFALKELYRSGDQVVPYLIEAWRKAGPGERTVYLEAMSRLRAEILPALAAALDSDDADLKLDILAIIEKRGAVDEAPNLWFLYASERQPERVRRKAADTLAYLLEVPVSDLPAAKVALVREANRYYRHEVTFADATYPVWQWNGQNVAATNMSVSQAEEYYGLRYASQALSLDPTYRPAQILVLSLALDKGYEQAGVAQPLSVTNPAVHQLLATTNPALITTVLERALDDKRYHVILGGVRALGEFAEARSGRAKGKGEPVLVRALNYPDKRVQMAAAEALLRSPEKPASEAAVRVVDVLRRVIAADAPAAKSAAKVLVSYFSVDQLDQVAGNVAKSGFTPVKARTGREVMQRLQEAADIDVLLLDSALPEPGLSSLLGNLRADQNAGRLPILLTANPNREAAVRRYAERFPKVRVVPIDLAHDVKELTKVLKASISDVSSTPLSEAEAREYGEKAIRYLGRMARGEPAGYDVRPASEAMLNAAASGRFSAEGQVAALEAASSLPGAKPQTVLTNVVLEQRRPARSRIVAADLLTRHFQKNGALLTGTQIQSLEAAYAQPDLDPGVKGRLAVVLGALRPSARVTGERIRNFRPASPQPKAAPEKEKEKEKDEK